MQDGRSRKRVAILETLLEEFHLNKVTAASPNLEALIRKQLDRFLLSHSAEKQYVETVKKLLRLELVNPGKRVDLSSGLVCLVDLTAAVAPTVQPQARQSPVPA